MPVVIRSEVIGNTNFVLKIEDNIINTLMKASYSKFFKRFLYEVSEKPLNIKEFNEILDELFSNFFKKMKEANMDSKKDNKERIKFYEKVIGLRRKVDLNSKRTSIALENLMNASNSLEDYINKK